MPPPPTCADVIQGLQVPPRLRAGDRLAAITLSWGGPAEFPARYEAGVRQLETQFGVEVREMRHTRSAPDVVAGDPRGRADDLHAAFADSSIAGIVSTIGGDDSIRLLPHLDLELIAAHPKVLVGYSDTTIAHLACLRAGVQTFYGPSIMAGFGESGGMHDYLVDGVRRMLFTRGAPGPWPPNPDGWTVEFQDWADRSTQQTPRRLQPPTGWRWDAPAGRTVEGPLVPACLEVVEGLRGTPWWPDLDGAVLALETSEEGSPPDVVTRFLRSLALTGELHRLAGLLMARPGGIDDPAQHPAYERSVLGVVRDEEHLDLPVVTNLDFGHTDPMWTLPVGGVVRIDPSDQGITFPAPVTTD